MNKWKVFIVLLIVLGILGVIVFILLPAGLLGLRISGKAIPVEIKGASMEPSYKEGQFWVIDEKHYNSNAPQRGEAIVYTEGEGGDQRWRTESPRRCG